MERKIRDSYVKVLEPCCVDINGSSDEDEDSCMFTVVMMVVLEM